MDRIDRVVSGFISGSAPSLHYWKFNSVSDETVRGNSEIAGRKLERAKGFEPSTLTLAT